MRIKDDCYNIVPYVQCIQCRQLLAYDPKSSGTRSISFHAQSCKVVSLDSHQNIERILMKSPTVSNETKKIFIDACIKFCFIDMRSWKKKDSENLCQTLLDVGRKSAASIESRDIIPDLTTISRRTLILADDERLFRVSYKIYILLLFKNGRKLITNKVTWDASEIGQMICSRGVKPSPPPRDVSWVTLTSLCKPSHDVHTKQSSYLSRAWDTGVRL